MKHPFNTIIFIFLLGQGYLLSEVRHVIVYTDGATEITLIDSISTDSLYYLEVDLDSIKTTALKPVYLIYNDFQKIFYVSPYLYTRMDYLEERGGYVVTTALDTLYYDQIKFDRHLRNPKVYLNPESDSLQAINFLDIYLIRANLTVMELAVRKGFYTSVGIFLLGTTLEIFADYIKNFQGKLLSVNSITSLTNEIRDEGNDLLPMMSSAGIERTGVTYHSLTFFIPLTTIGWMIYDYIFDKRTQYIRPLDRENTFPRDMYIFSLKRWLSEKTKALVRSQFPRKKSESEETDSNQQD